MADISKNQILAVRVHDKPICSANSLSTAIVLIVSELIIVIFSLHMSGKNRYMDTH